MSELYLFASSMKALRVLTAGPDRPGLNLGAIVADFKRHKRRVPLKFATEEGEVVFGQPTGHPALGWLRLLWREGNSLVGYFADVPGVVLNRLASGIRVRVSAEVDGDTLKAVSIGGLGMPATRTVEELRAVLMTEGSPGEIVDRMARTYSAEAGVRYWEAVKETLRANPRLAKAYVLRRSE